MAPNTLRDHEARIAQLEEHVDKLMGVVIGLAQEIEQLKAPRRPNPLGNKAALDNLEQRVRP